MAQARGERLAGRRTRVHTVRDGWRAGRLLLEAHAEVPGYGAALRLVSVPFLLTAGLATMAAAFELVLAPSVVVVVLILRVA